MQFTSIRHRKKADEVTQQNNMRNENATELYQCRTIGSAISATHSVSMRCDAMPFSFSFFFAFANPKNKEDIRFNGLNGTLNFAMHADYECVHNVHEYIFPIQWLIVMCT